MYQEGHTSERLDHDYGIDLLVTTYDERGAEEPLRIQVKGTDHLNVLADQRTISISLSRSHIAGWIHETAPVILIVYDAQRDVAY